MFAIVFKPLAIKQLKKMKRYYAEIVLETIERRLTGEPEKIQGSIKRLRGRQQATFRLRVQDYRIFYDVLEDHVEIIQILHKSETQSFYEKEGQ